ncbi:phage major capsid protein, P2 family [Kiloniella sp. b19]|uniref:phage major capsid protein, P2 family n=1 Tax=Kiloniella sp. GXU_MW_B19 TaxID=3141326 RepID=UPI0031D3579E
MENSTRLAFDQFTGRIAELNGITDATKSFSVEPSVAQTLEDKVQENAEFLGMINSVGVDQMKGETLKLGTNSPIASRTDTSSKDRTTRDITGLDDSKYEVAKTDFDSHITYAKLDLWAKFPDFQARIQNHILLQIARDRLMIGWNGISRAADTDLANNPLLQDVNEGWLHQMRTLKSDNVLSGAKIGTLAGNDYQNFDAAVFDAIHSFLDPWHRDDTGIVAICGSALVADKYLGLINNNNAPTEKAALETIMMSKQIGGRKAITVPFFPADAIFLTHPKNLSVYWQKGTHRRKIEDNAKRDRIENYQSVNEAYVIEDLGACALIEGIRTPDGNDWSVASE